MRPVQRDRPSIGLEALVPNAEPIQHNAPEKVGLRVPGPVGQNGIPGEQRLIPEFPVGQVSRQGLRIAAGLGLRPKHAGDKGLRPGGQGTERLPPSTCLRRPHRDLEDGQPVGLQRPGIAERIQGPGPGEVELWIVRVKGQPRLEGP